MKIAVIGGGSTYTPELVTGFLAYAGRLPLKDLWLMDTDPQRLEIVGGFARRMVAAQGGPFEIVLSTSLRESMAGAGYIITQLRVGQMPARRADEYLGRRHGLIGQETTGVGGMAKALRTIPVMLDIANELRATAAQGQPLPLLLNFTNPAGLVTEALVRYAPEIPVVGVCNVAITTKMRILAEMEKQLGGQIDPGRAQLDTLGINHLTWHRGFRMLPAEQAGEGQDLWPLIFPAYVEIQRSQPAPEWDAPTLEALGMIPNPYLQYYYYTGRKLEEQEGWPPSRSEQVMEIERDLLQQYADPALVTPPAGLMQRGGAYYSTLAVELIVAHSHDLGQVHVVNVPHGGAVPGWPTDWVLEMPARVDRSGIHPLPAEPLPPVCFGLLAQVKAYELLAVEAAIHGDRQAAYQALLAHPLGPPADRAQAVLEDMLEINRAYPTNF